MTGRESLYAGTCFVGRAWTPGWLDEDEQAIKTLGVRVAAQGEYAVRQAFDGAVWIGSKDYREASWKDFAGFAHTLKLGGFTFIPACRVLFQRSSQRRKQSWRPSPPWCRSAGKSQRIKAAKVQNTSYPSRLNQLLTFTSFNFKLAVMEVLMYEKGLLAPKLDAHEFAQRV